METGRQTIMQHPCTQYTQIKKQASVIPKEDQCPKWTMQFKAAKHGK